MLFDVTDSAPHDHQTSAPAPVTRMTAGEWDEMYAEKDRVWSGRPNHALVVETSHLSPGTALDVGCGEGADALWLAGRGWTVTALDVSSVALERAAAAAGDAGIDVAWVHGGLTDATLPADGFDLVTAAYPALPSIPPGASVEALLAAVAPGGTLFVLHHDLDPDVVAAHGFDPAVYVSHGDVVGRLDERWRVEIDERRPRTISGGSGAHHVNDLVLRAVRVG